MKPLDTGFTALQQVAELANSRCKTRTPRRSRQKPPEPCGPVATRERGTWTQEVDAKLRALAAERLTAAAIGAALGRTRSAVLGRAHRLGVRIGTPNSGNGRKRAVFTRRQMVPGVWTYATKLGSSLTPEPLPVEEEWKGPVVALADLERTQCHFPVGDPAAPGFGYCGCPDTVERGEGRTRYCRQHYRKMYQPRTR